MATTLPARKRGGVTPLPSRRKPRTGAPDVNMQPVQGGVGTAIQRGAQGGIGTAIQQGRPVVPTDPAGRAAFTRWLDAANKSNPDYWKARTAAMSPAQQTQFRNYIGAANGNIPAQPLPTTELAAFGARRNAANLNYNQGLSRLAFERNGVQQQFGSASRNLTKQYGQAREQVPYSALQRGILGSGIYRQDLSQLAQDRTHALGDLLQQRTQGLGDLSLRSAGLQQTRGTLLADIEAQQAARRQQLAQQIRSMK